MLFTFIIRLSIVASWLRSVISIEINLYVKFVFKVIFFHISEDIFQLHYAIKRNIQLYEKKKQNTSDLEKFLLVIRHHLS